MFLILINMFWNINHEYEWQVEVVDDSQELNKTPDVKRFFKAGGN